MAEDDNNIYRDSFVTRGVEAIKRGGPSNPNFPNYGLIAPSTGGESAIARGVQNFLAPGDAQASIRARQQGRIDQRAATRAATAEQQAASLASARQRATLGGRTGRAAQAQVDRLLNPEPQTAPNTRTRGRSAPAALPPVAGTGVPLRSAGNPTPEPVGTITRLPDLPASGRGTPDEPYTVQQAPAGTQPTNGSRFTFRDPFARERGGGTFNVVPSIFSYPDPYPDRGGRGALPNRSGPNIVYLGGNPNDPLTLAQERAASLFERARNEGNPADRSALLREALAAARFSEGTQRGEYSADINQRNDLTRRDIAELTSADRNRQLQADSRDRRDIAAARINAGLYGDQLGFNARIYDTDARSALGDARIRAEQPLNEARAAYYTAGAQPQSVTYLDALAPYTDAVATFGADSPEADQMLRLSLAGMPEDMKRQALESINSYAMGGYVEPVQNYADGGLVDAPVRTALGGSLGPATPDLPQLAAMQDYQDYSAKAAEMGLPSVGFDEFISLQQGPAKQSLSFADGGMVPDASGKMVIDPDPNAPTDSIPAVVDEETPAKLDSGEFVIPKDVVLFYGTDKLNKMIEKARQPEGQNGAGQQAGSALGR